MQADVLEHVADGVVLADGADVARYLNPAAERMVGRSRARATGRSLSELPGGPALRLLAERARAASSPAAQDDLRFPEAPVDVLVAPLEGPGEDGAEGWVVLTLRDRSIARQLEADARHSERLASFATLAAGIAHEVKNPLGGIRGAAQLLARGVSAERDREYLELIVREVDRIAALVDRLRDLAAADRPASRSPVDLNRLLHELATLHGATGEGALELDLDPSLPRVDGDPDELRRLFLNLVRNAFEAPARRVQIATRVETGRRWRDPEGHVHALVSASVTDDGPGIPPEHRPRLFEPFFTTKESGEGTGLGLSVSQEIVREHGGRIAVTSVLGKGSRFSILLPPAGPA